VHVQGRLVAAWFRRKRLEAQLIANAVGRLFGGGEQPGYEAIDEQAALAAVGVTPKYVGPGTDHATAG
jgi:hypothetical protein